MTDIKYPQIPIAIIGMGCMFAKSSALKDFWRLIYHGQDGIEIVPATHWSVADYYDKDPKRPDHVYCRRGGFLPPVSFDPTEFGIPPANLEATDTSQLLSLLTAKAALNDAGYLDGKPFDRDRTSVILGATGTQELAIPLGARLGHPHWRRALQAADIPADKIEQITRDIAAAYVPWQENSFPGLLGNVVAGRICNRLDLGGTNCVVDAACASSMSALHLSLLELTTSRSDMVIAGGVDLLNDIFMHMCFSSTFILSPTEDIRPFSKDADGTLLGEGLGMLVLKRLPDAERDGDRIYALIRALGSSSDGRSQSIYAPRSEGQEKALRTAYALADISPNTVELIEAHGTGTRVGDQVEFQTLKNVFGKSTPNGRRCAIGSVKSQIGHSKAAAGSAALIKTALALYHKVLPPTLKAETADPRLGMEESPFYLNQQSRPWVTTSDSPRRAGVSSFGFGGSNFHVVLEEYQPQKQAVSWDGTVEILSFCAPAHDLLTSQLTELTKSAKAGWTSIDLAVEAYESRKRFSAEAPFRLLMAIEMPRFDAEKLSNLFTAAINALNGNPPDHSWQLPNIFYGCGPVTGKMAVLFPGQGSQYTGMGNDLICTFPEALAVLASADNLFQQSNPQGNRLSDIIFPFDTASEEKALEFDSRLRSTDNAQPAIGAVSLAMWRVLQRFNVQPDVAGGHSFGELTALCAAGWCDEPSLHTLSIRRGQCMAAASNGKDHDAGTMMAVLGPLNELANRLEEAQVDVVIANRNSPEQGVLSGPAAAVTLAETKCRDWRYKTKRLPVSAAFHSPLMASACKPFESALAGITFTPTKVRVYANTDGRPYPKDSAIARQRLSDQLVKPVEFIKNIQNMQKDGVRTILEVGPKSVLAGLCKSILKEAAVNIISLDSSSGKRNGVMDLATVLCRLGALGYSIALNQWEDPVTRPARPKMNVTLTGANIRSSKPETPKLSASGTPALSRPVLPVREPIPDTMEIKTNDMHISPTQSTSTGQHPLLSPNTGYPPASTIENALRVAEQGLKSMQALQMKTAETHQKFLDTQAEAGRALKEMMDSARQMTGFIQGHGIPRPRTTPTEKAPKTDQTVSTAIPVPASRPMPIPETPLESKPNTKAVIPAALQTVAVQAAPEETAEKNDIAGHLLAIVSKLTGYPEDMLNLDMDIESDLGIDSIKRVEILSTLAESLPGLPPVQPEIMGRLKTLGQIVDHLSQTHGKTKKKDSKPAAPPENKATPPGIPTSDLEEALMQVVSRLTGYPREMLELEMDIEADLGIDSIKRVEILSSLAETIPGLPRVQPETMGRLKTLAQIVHHLSAPGQVDTSPKTAPSATVDKDPVTPGNTSDDGTTTVARSVVRLEKCSFQPVSVRPIDSNGTLYITADASGLSDALAAAFCDLGQSAQALSADAVQEILKTEAFPADACGLVMIPDAGRLSDNGMDPLDIETLKSWFFLTRCAASTLTAAAETRSALFAAITFMDGAFGFGGNGMTKPAMGALAGLVKTAAIEWEKVICRAIDVSPDWAETRELAIHIATELMNESRRHQTETGLTPSGIISLCLSSAPDAPGDGNEGVITSSDVFVITGGGRGVTAASAFALAQTATPTLVLLGRSEPPFLEPAWLSGLTTAAEIKKAVISHEFNQQTPSPRAVEAIYSRYAANREISQNIDRINATGAQVHYFQLDVRHEAEVTTVLEKVRAIHGPVTGILHGAGVLEDRLIVDKTPEQISRVFDTKIRGAQNLLVCTKADPLRYVVFFSSVAARFGNRGQADYAMANEMLNKMAEIEAFQRPSCRTISINWGPWDGGMVTDALKREFTKRGIDLIPMAAGARCLVREMTRPGTAPAQIVLGAALEGHSTVTEDHRGKTIRLPSTHSAPADLSLLFKREIDVQRLPVLQSHQLDGIPVVPFALIAEWIGHGAMHGNPGLYLHGLDDLRLLKGIRLEHDTKTIRLMAGKARKKGDVYEVNVEIRNGVKDGKDVIHSRAKAVLSSKVCEAPMIAPTFISCFAPYEKSVQEVYETILFHGVALQGLQQIIGLSEQGMAAKIAAAPKPEKWMVNPLRTRWISDPLALDSAFQMACVWCYEYLGAVSLPSYTASYRQFCREFPKDGVTAVLEVTSRSRHKMIGDITFVDADHTVVATLGGYEAIADTSLYKSFKPDKIAS